MIRARSILHVGLLASLAWLTACSATKPSTTEHISGEVYYLQRIALPPGAVLSVKLQDTSRADAPAITLAEYNKTITQSVPLPFTLNYQRNQVKAGLSYSLSARIEYQGQLLFINTEHHPVQLGGSIDNVKLRVDPVQ